MLPGTRKRFLAFDPDLHLTEPLVQFRLTYEGRLEGNGSPKHKHEIRKALHPQLKRLWEVEPNLSRWRLQLHGVNSHAEMVNFLDPAVHAIAAENERHGFRFVPLATDKLSLRASIDVLFLRPDVPGSVIRSGDIDNRLKTLFDALKMPGDKSELGGYGPAEGEDPFFVLLADDKLISHVSVETDILLQPTPTANGDFLANDARLVITVELRPYQVHMENLHFA